VDERRFWEIVDATLPAAADRERQEELLWEQLVALPPDEVAAFDWWFDRQLIRSDCDNVNAAWALIDGVGSDDGYHDFCCWLVSRGRVAFEAALADPDSLSAVVVPDEDTQFMDFGCVAQGVYEHLTGDECPDLDLPRPEYPKAERWDTRDINEARRRMPRLRSIFLKDGE
jgi:hypothetical protein